jgi:hypothetical protein
VNSPLRVFVSCSARFQVLTAANMKFRVSGMYCRLVKYILTDVSEVRSASIIRAIRYQMFAVPWQRI